MKTRIKNLFLVSACTGLLAMPAAAQTFTLLHSFTGDSDGGSPQAGLILSGNTLYGTTDFGGSSSNGIVFAINTDGTGFTNLHSFTASFGSYPFYANNDGANPLDGLILSGNTLYGTTDSGGMYGDGTIFSINTNGMSFTNLYSFTATSYPGFPYTNSDGGSPLGGLVLSDNTLYGTTKFGSSSGRGAVFAINTDGTGFTNLYSFIGTGGSNPEAGLIVSGNTLYGTTFAGGSSGYGNVFRVNTDGLDFTNLHGFPSYYPTNSDGANPQAGLILSGNTLYGTAEDGGSSDSGTVFAVNTDGSSFTNLHSFTGGDGLEPVAGLILSGNTLYGTTSQGGSSDDGTVFSIHIDGSGFTNLHIFTGSDGVIPDAGLILSGNTLYGTTSRGGSSGVGTVFSLSLPVPPQLAIIFSGTKIILTWPTNAIGFILQSTTNLVSSAIWSTNLPSPVVVNGQNSVTNPISGTQQFYRLVQQP
jgi:uncharacterized repeat protein (TIGR03803 family)